MSCSLRRNVGYRLPGFVAYWGNNGQVLILASNGYGAIDPTATCSLLNRRDAMTSVLHRTVLILAAISSCGAITNGIAYAID